MTKISVLVLILLFSPKSRAQTAVFDVRMAGHSIGSVKGLPASQSGSLSSKRIEAEFTVPFYSGSFVSKNQFLDGALHTSSTEQTLNGKRKEQTVTRHVRERHYEFGSEEIKSKPGHARAVTIPAPHTITGMYYQEPVGVSEVYSEKYGQMCRLQKVEDGKYRVLLPKGKESFYTYRAGHCVEVATELGGFRLSIVRKQVQLTRR